MECCPSVAKPTDPICDVGVHLSRAVSASAITVNHYPMFGFDGSVQVRRFVWNAGRCYTSLADRSWLFVSTDMNLYDILV